MYDDPWTRHLAKYDLVELHNEAQEVGYRIRTADGYIFTLEYEAGLAKYYQSGYALKTFEDTAEGREQTRQFLSEVAQDIQEERQKRRLERALEELNQLQNIDQDTCTDAEWEYRGDMLADLFAQFQQAGVQIVYDYNQKIWTLA